MKKILILVAIATAILFSGCNYKPSQTAEDAATVEKQNKQYAKGQPVPMYDWSLERDLVIKLYNLRNQRVSTHSVWRSDYGIIEGDCTSMGYGLPYDTSLTNPDKLAHMYVGSSTGRISGVVGQAEPNGIFASTNTAATWVMCVGTAGLLEPHYVESKVTVYPYPVKVNYNKNRVIRAGKSTANIKAGK